MSHTWTIYRRWLIDRRTSTLWWSVGIAAMSVVTAAFYPAVKNAASNGAGGDTSSAMSSILSLGEGIDPSTPVGWLWSANYSNQLPWVLMALGIALGVASIAGEESEGTLEYTLAKPVKRRQIVVGRFLAMVTVLVIASAVNFVAVWATLPLFDLNTAVAASEASAGGPAATATDLLVGGVAALAVGLGTAAVAFVIGAATGRKGFAMGVTSAYAVAGYVLYTMSNTTGKLEWITWLAPWRWFSADAMMINGLSWDLLFPVALAIVCLGVSLWGFERRDLRS
jgi:ABC-2 type transport system permease protein